MITANDFVHKHGLKNKAKSNIKIQQILSYLGLNDVGMVNLHPNRGTHWVCYINEIYFDSYGCSPPKNLSKFIIKQNRYCLYSKYQI